MKARLIVLLAMVLVPLGAAGQAAGFSTKHRPKASLVCADAVEGAAYYRLWTWRWQDQLRVKRERRDYHPGRPVRSCSRARTLAVRWQTRAERHRARAAYLNSHVRAAIISVFGPDEGPGAIVVAECETGHLLDDPEAAMSVRTGQYVGIFQMGEGWEVHTWARWRGRVRYGTVLDQVWAAYRMWRDRTWQAWACRPDGSVAY